MKENLASRCWYYFRQGWGLYFAFVLAAINTLTVTYFLAIQEYPILKEVFPTFFHYILIVASIGIPLLIGIGYTHHKRSSAYRSETGVVYETNPYVRRNLVNSELNLQINVQLLEILSILSNNQSTDEEMKKKISEVKNEILEMYKNRSFQNDTDADILRKMRET